jgi:hypothetical protein
MKYAWKSKRGRTKTMSKGGARPGVGRKRFKPLYGKVREHRKDFDGQI